MSVEKFSRRVTNVATGIMILAGTIFACQVVAPVTSPMPAAVTDQVNCPAACTRLSILGCSQANNVDMHAACVTNSDCKDVDGGADPYQTCVAGGCKVTCVAFCEETEAQGVYLDPTCVMAITSCDQVDTCPLITVPSTSPSCTGPSCPAHVVSPTQ